MKSLKGSKTAENLMKSFAGECQARTRYTYYSSVAKRKGMFKFPTFSWRQQKMRKSMQKDFISS